MKRIAAATLGLTVTVLVASCETDLSDRILSIPSSATVEGLIYLDRNQSGSFEANVDQPLADVDVAVRRPGSSQDVAAITSDSLGMFRLQLPPGSYVFRVPPSTLGDTLEITAAAAAFTVGADDTVRVTAGVRFRTYTPAEVRALPVGSHVWLTGVALNNPGAFGDSTVHVAETGAAIRVTRVRPLPVFPGDSLYFLGTVTTRNGQPALVVDTCHPATPTCFVAIAGVTFQPSAGTVTTAAAANAAGGSLDAAMVEVEDVLISDTTTNAAGSRVLTVNDGSGPLRIVLSAPINWSPINTWVPGVTLNAVGVLVPTGSVWELKPRDRNDLSVQTVPPPAGAAAITSPPPR